MWLSKSLPANANSKTTVTMAVDDCHALLEVLALE
jgi:hypothetical protein